MTNIPQWADADLSAQLPQLRETGEGPAVEFKGDFPEQSHKLAKELAALGTSGGGILIVGVNDAGELAGLKADNGDERDMLFERMHGIVQTIKPRLRVDILLGMEEGLTVLVVKVPKQSEPVFYYDGRPYIRDGRRSRPAEPDEITACVWAHPSSAHQRAIERIELQTKQDYANNLQALGPRPR